MHEYPATVRIIELAIAAAKEKNVTSVKSIHVTIGENCGYLSESIELYFDLVAAGTVCENATLTFAHIKPKMRCDKCGELFIRVPFSFDCPICGAADSAQSTEIGREFIVDEITV